MIDILYQDRELAVCRKPAGLLSQDGPGDTLPSLLRAQLGGEIFPVHRLDRDAGGVMVCARTRRAAGSLSGAISQGEFRKEYLCIVRGRPEEDEGTYRDLLLHDKSRNKSFVVQRMRGGVKEAVLDYRLLAERDGLSLVRVRLHTGRTHQIRVQFSSRGTPRRRDGAVELGAGVPPSQWKANGLPGAAGGRCLDQVCRGAVGFEMRKKEGTLCLSISEEDIF